MGKPSSTAISQRLQVAQVQQIKLTSNQRDVPSPSPIKLRLAEKAEAKRDRAGSKG